MSTSSTLSCTYSAFALSTARGLKKNKSVLIQQLSGYLKSGDTQSKVLIMKESLIGVEKGCAEGIRRIKKGCFSPLELTSLKAGVNISSGRTKRSFRLRYRASLCGWSASLLDCNKSA